MNVQLDLFPTEVMETKSDVFYVRSRKRIKQSLLLRMQEDKFTSMADWFDQWVPRALAATAKGANYASSNKRKPKRSRRKVVKKRNLRG